MGDKTSIAVGPIVAACGVPLGKMSGRGLGHTGGTLDKLESIPGFRVELSTDEMIAQLRDIGVAIVGQSDHLVPADKKLYALRDVTATVDIVPLIASSIMSKKLAAGADAIVLDVKVGDGAFMKTLDDARVLAERCSSSAERAGKEVTCLLTDMDQPLGRAVGNALEIREALDTVRGEGPPDFTELVLDACARLLATPTSGSTPTRGGGAPRRPSRTARRSTSTSAGSGRRAATPTRPLAGGAGRSAGDAPRARRRSRARRARRRHRRARARRRPADEAGRDRPRRRRALLCQARASVEQGDDLAEVHARDEAAERRRSRPSSRPTRSPTSRPRSTILLDVVA